MRECGTCTECCTVVPVRELGKANHVRCTHETDNGCAIYADRPPGCRGYNCLWIIGELAGDERPDKVNAVCNRIEVPKVGEMIMVRLSNQADSRNADSEAMRFVARLTRDENMIVCLTRETEPPTMLGKPDLLQWFIERSKEVA